jgi:hypothetical protein
VLVEFLESLLREQEQLALRGEGGADSSNGSDSLPSSSPWGYLSSFYELKTLCRLYAGCGVLPFTLLLQNCCKFWAGRQPEVEERM